MAGWRWPKDQYPPDGAKDPLTAGSGEYEDSYFCRICWESFIEEPDVIRDVILPESESVATERTTAARPATLLITFGGLAQGIGGGEGMIPPFEFFKMLHGHRLPEAAGGPLHLLFLRDRRQTWYFEGVWGISSTIHQTVTFLRKEAERIPELRRVFCLGSSMGGFAAILHGTLLALELAKVRDSLAPRVEKILAFAPQIFLDHRERAKRRLEERYEKRLVEVARFASHTPIGSSHNERRFLMLDSLVPFPCQIDIHLGSMSTGDILMAEELHMADGGKAGRVQLVVHPDGSHNVVTELRDRGGLAPILRQLLNGR